VGLPEGGNYNDFLGLEVREGDVTTTSERGPTPTPVPTAVVTCVDATPSLTASEVPSPQVSVSASPAPSLSDVPAAASSPFECGFEFPSESWGTQDFGVDVTSVTLASWPGSTLWTTTWTRQPESIATSDVADLSVLDPTDPRREFPADANAEDPQLSVNEGVSFVAVVDHVDLGC
jgi:hypothetical protein